MTTRHYEFESVNGSTVVFVDPLNVKNTLRSVMNLSKSTLGSNKFDIANGSLNETRSVSVQTPGCVDPCTAAQGYITLNTSIKGPIVANAATIQAIKDHAANLLHLADRYAAGRTISIADTNLVIDLGVA